MARKSGHIIRGGRTIRRTTMWLSGNFATNTLASTNAVALIGTLNAAGLALRPFTVVRTRGNMFLRSDQTSALELYSTSMGFAIVSDQAVAIGVTAVPTPETDMASDLWYVYEQMTSIFTFVSGVGFHPAGGISRTYDSKAMRKVDVGQDIAQVIECPSTSGVFSDQSRILIKLH